jgi:hypothetical protein
MIAILLPFKAVGPIKLGERINICPYPFEILVEGDNKDQDIYELENEKISVTVTKGGVIDAIICENELIYKGVNLIGIEYQVFLCHMSIEDIYESDSLDFLEGESPQLVYDIDEYGLQVWTRDDIVVTIIVSGEDE